LILHADFAVGKLLPQYFLGAFGAYEHAGVKNFTKKIVSQKSRVDTQFTFKLIVVEIQIRQFGAIPK
jgi:hypothetical protein